MTRGHRERLWRRIVLLRALLDGATHTSAEIAKVVQLDITQVAYALRGMFKDGLVWRGMEYRVVASFNITRKQRRHVYRITAMGVENERRIPHTARTQESGT